MSNVPRNESAQLQEILQRLQHEKSEVEGMMQILTSKLQEAQEENFDLHASMSLFETETRLEGDKKEREMQNKVSALESKLSFMSEKLQNAERAKLRVIKEVEDLQQKQRVENKRRDAERRLMATKRRKHESFLATSQSIAMTQQQVMKVSVPVMESAVQTENPVKEETERDHSSLTKENARLISYLLTGTSRDLLTLLNGVAVVRSKDEAQENADVDRTQLPQGWHSSTPTQFLQNSSGNSLNGSIQQSSGGVPFSQSVFSQVTGRTSASFLDDARETNAEQNTLVTERARELYDVMGRMLTGDVSAVALVPVFIKYLTTLTDLEWTVMCSVLRVMYSVMHHSTHFQRFLTVASSSSDATSSTNAELQRNSNSMEHPRIVLPGLRFISLDEYLSAQSEYGSMVQNDLLQASAAEAAADQKEIRSKLMCALCRAVKSNIKEPVVVKDGLRVLCFWVDLGLADGPALMPDFKPLLASNVISGILLAPKSIPTVKAQAVGLLSQLLRVPEIFIEVAAESKKILLFNRCVKMLLCEGNLSRDEVSSVRAFQHQIVKLLLSIITLYPSEGICFVLESTHGLPGDPDGYRSVIYYLARLLDQETFEIRTGGESFETHALLRDHFRLDLIQDAFALVGLLSRYVDLRSELGGDDQAHSFLAVLHFLSNLPHDGIRKLAASARAFVIMMNLARP
ncbi:hypothetical protein DD238_001935 [Peronospora effusa]|uniref:Uncharacterized protein n=1 Tax=Peronospora effusa TaxID=542832 RepID=A0A3M6VSH8_9STRA|nr:hypothetical protein DD238_001935 [Peronospora effusa]RQM18718.1 hypothetical protein DD237_000903 [Peronospora effusa]